MIRATIDPDDLRRLHAERISIGEIAKRLGSSASVIARRLQELGLPTGRYWWIDSTEIAARYLAGTPIQTLATDNGVSADVITLRLDREGVKRRDRHEVALLRASQTPPEVRSRNAEAAHAAVRGRRHPFEEQCQRAATREARELGVSRIERMTRRLLEERGFSTCVQKAVGPYNIDVAINEPPIAVEIFGGHWHTAGRHAARFRKRTDYLIDSGWIPVFIWVTRDYPLELGAIEYVVSLAEQMRRGEPVRRQEHMIRGDGQPSAVGECHLNNRPVIPGPQPRDDTSGRFTPRIG